MKILILGGSGLVGSSLIRVLPTKLKNTILYYPKRSEANLFSLNETKNVFKEFKPDVIINAAAKVGGIFANNTLRSQFILENLKINMNLLETFIDFPKSYFINLGSSCIYPLNAESPINEDSLMTGKLEPTNSPYAMAKLTSIEIASSISKQYGHKIINLMPTNLYGPNDNFTDESSHVIPGLIYRMHYAKQNNEKEFNVWGTGKPLREFLYVDDLADAISFIIEKRPDNEILNIGSGSEISINDLVNLIKDTINYEGKINFDSTKPDGNPRKLINSQLINNLGWEAKTSLNKGLEKTYSWYKKFS